MSMGLILPQGLPVMDEEILKFLKADPSPEEQRKAMEYFSELKDSPMGWRLCIQVLSSRHFDSEYSRFVFFCFQVLEYHAINRHKEMSQGDQEFFRDFLTQWPRKIENFGPPYVGNKVAQVATFVFLEDYPTKWPSFFQDLLVTFQLGQHGVDYFLRIILSVHFAAGDPEVRRRPDESIAAEIIKTEMKLKELPNIVEAMFHIISTFEHGQMPIYAVEFCLLLIGLYIQWVDVNLFVNDRFMNLFVRKLGCNELRNAVSKCIYSILDKGMIPMEKFKLVETLYSALENSKVWDVLWQPGHDPKYVKRLGKICDRMGVSLVEISIKVKKEKTQLAALGDLREAIYRKVQLAKVFLISTLEDVSATVIEFLRAYLQFLRSQQMNENEKISVKEILISTCFMFQYPQGYNFDNEGENEAQFLEYRKQLKVLFDNIAFIDMNMVVEYTIGIVSQVLTNMRETPMEKVEAALHMLYLLGECIHINGPAASSHFDFDLNLTKNLPIQRILIQLNESEVYLYPHPNIVIQYFENVIRYDKFYSFHEHFFMVALAAFLKPSGLFHSNPKVRSRCAYLFSKFIKSHRNHLTQDLTREILKTIAPLLMVKLPCGDVEEPLLSDDDQLYLYEVAGTVIVSGEKSLPKKGEYLREVVVPLIQTVKLATTELIKESRPDRRELIGDCAVQAISLTGRTSKAFNNLVNMKACGSIPTYLEALETFLLALKIPHERELSMISTAVRAYLHRMVVCMEEELLPYIPAASESLLENCDSSRIVEYIPLINQVIGKYKKDIIPFLLRVFVPLLDSIFAALSSPIEDNDMEGLREREMLRRTYFSFLAAVVLNNVTEVLQSQPPEFLHRVLTTVIQGAVEYPDPVAQKYCFSILRRLVDQWGGGAVEGFVDFIYKSIIPATFLSPLKPSFDLADAQYILVLNEIASCLLSVYSVRKDESIMFLRTHYLPTLQLPQNKIEEFLGALQGPVPQFKTFIKSFYNIGTKKGAGNNLN